MRNPALFALLKGIGVAVLLLMAVAMVYAGGISIAYWSGIGV